MFASARVRGAHRIKGNKQSCKDGSGGKLLSLYVSSVRLHIVCLTLETISPSLAHAPQTACFLHCQIIKRDPSNTVSGWDSSPPGEICP